MDMRLQNLVSLAFTRKKGVYVTSNTTAEVTPERLGVYLPASIRT
jgi:hypothetical protein